MKTFRTLLALTLLAGFAVSPAFALDHHEKDIVATAQAAGMFNTLLKAATAAGLAETLQGEGPYTVFAPTDEAFAKVPKKKLDELMKPENKEHLKALLLHHVVKGKVSAAEAIKMDGKRVDTVGGKKVKLSVMDGSVYVGKAKVVKADVMASNGVIHVIDKVLMPPKEGMATPKKKKPAAE